jgi:hypothetical protein
MPIAPGLLHHLDMAKKRNPRLIAAQDGEKEVYRIEAGCQKTTFVKLGYARRNGVVRNLAE